MIEYRKAVISDINKLLTARLDFWRSVKNITNEEETLLEYTRTFLLSSLANGNFIQWLALDNNKIVGTSGLSLFFLPPNSKRLSGKVAYIGNMFTYPDYRKKGIATKLLDFTVNSAKEAGCKEIWLDSTDDGISIYEKFGFKRNENSMNYYVK